MIWIVAAGLSVSGALFVWALVLITRKSAPTPLLDYSQKYYDKLMPREEIDYYNQARWD